MFSNDKLVIKLLIAKIKKIPKLWTSFNFSYKSQKYKLADILTEILYVLKTGISWRMLRSPIHWNTIYKIYIKLNNYKIFKISYKELLQKYVVKNKNKLKFIFTDTSVIPNKYGLDKAKLNKFYKNKKVMKLSLITLKNGIPINVKLYDGNRNDSYILNDQLRTSNLIKINDSQKKYFMADKGYDSKNIRQKLTAQNYKVIIPQNKRGIKDESKIIKFDKGTKLLYRKRILVENMFCKLKTFRRLSVRYDKYSKTYSGFLWLALINIIIKT
jgi:transposase